MPRKNCKCDYACLYGYCKSDKSLVGWLSIFPEEKSGRYGQYDVVDDEEQASKFKARPSKEEKESKKFWTPEKICKFINEEDELSDWKFHVVWRKNSIAKK